MKKIIVLLIFILFSVMLLSADGEGTITQASTINAVLKGLYDGEITFGELKKYGDFGVGYFHKMAGEVLALDGVFYRIKSDGLTEIVKDSDKTPFFMIAMLKSDSDHFTNRKLDYNELKQYILKMLPRKKSFYAIKIKGVFTNLKARTLLRQAKSYSGIGSVIKSQVRFNIPSETKGTLIGFYTPDFMEGVSIPGFHFHFMSEDKTKGGHVNSLNVVSITIEFKELKKFQLLIPENQDYHNANLEITKSLKKSLKKLEAQQID